MANISIVGTYKSEDGEEKTVFCTVTDLNEFVQADSSKNVFVEDEDGLQWSMPKGNITFNEILM